MKHRLEATTAAELDAMRADVARAAYEAVTTPEPKPKRTRPARDYIWVEVTPSERARLERLVAARGERATLAGVMRELLAKAERIEAVPELIDAIEMMLETIGPDWDDIPAARRILRFAKAAIAKAE